MYHRLTIWLVRTVVCKIPCDREMFKKVNMQIADKIFGVQTEEDKKKEIKEEKESKEKLAELDQYQEDRKKARDKNYRKLAAEEKHK